MQIWWDKTITLREYRGSSGIRSSHRSDKESLAALWNVRKQNSTLLQVGEKRRERISLRSCYSRGLHKASGSYYSKYTEDDD